MTTTPVFVPTRLRADEILVRFVKPKHRKRVPTVVTLHPCCRHCWPLQPIGHARRCKLGCHGPLPQHRGVSE